MTLARIGLSGLLYYWRTNAATVFGIAGAVAVLAGALLVGTSVRASLERISANRIGRTEVVVASENAFTEELAARIAAEPDVSRRPTAPAPMFILDGVAIHEPSGRRAGAVRVYGVDSRFFAFHGVGATAPSGSEVLLSPDLAGELGASPGDAMRVRVARPTDIPLDALHGRRDNVGRSIRLQHRGVLSGADMGEFALDSQQGPVRAVFLPLPRLQRDLDQPGRVNTLLLLSAEPGAAADAALVRSRLGPSLRIEDLGLRLDVLPDTSTILIESSTGLIADGTASAIESAAVRESFEATRLLTWLANRMTAGGRTIPYSLITAVGPDAAGDAALAGLLAVRPDGPPPIVLNEWAARDLQAVRGQSLQLEYYRWADEGRLVTDNATFQIAGVLPMRGLAIDARLAPEYPGITTSDNLADWDPPFPIDLGLVRPIDEEFWKRFRTAPKAFIPLAAGQQLWRTRHGQLTSLRLRPSAAGVDVRAVASRIATSATRAVDPVDAGFVVIDVARERRSASAGGTDFGAYFSYFSFFLMVSALLLAALYFRLGIEQRLSQVGLLRAAGFPVSTVRRLFLIEGVAMAVIGAIAGIGLAIGWAALMMYGLRTWWVDAVRTTLLELHVDGRSLGIGAAGAAVAAVLSIAFTVRGLRHVTPRALLTGARESAGTVRLRRYSIVTAFCFAAAIALAVLSAVRVMPPAGGFFGAGALLLLGGLLAFRRWLADSRYVARNFSSASASRILPPLARLGIINTSWRPGRSLTAAGLVASAAFLLVSVDVFRKSTDAASSRTSGTGGFALTVETALPFAHDPATPPGREALGLEAGPGDALLAGTEFTALRLRAGDDASCLNLYRPQRPRIVGVPERLVDAGRFRFAGSIGERTNPWRLLGEPDSDGVVPVIVDQTSLQYVLHASVGDVLLFDEDTARPFRVRVVAALDDSMLQGEILMAERAFVRLFPEVEGYRVLLVDVTPPSAPRVDEVARAIEDRLEPFGADAEETTRRLEAYHRVENTYLSTFQALGGLGLLLGTFGLVAIVARNVLERRRELALLGAAGFTGRQLQLVVVAEHAAVIAAGLAIGLFSALVATVPVLISRGSRPSLIPLIWLVVVAVTGVAAAAAATRSVRRLPLVASLRNE